MDAKGIQAALRELGVCVESEAAEYVAKALQSSPKVGKLPVLGGNARTGVPVRQMIALDDLSNARPSVA